MVDAIKAFVCALMVGFACIPDRCLAEASVGARAAVAIIMLVWIFYWTSRVIHFLN